MNASLGTVPTTAAAMSLQLWPMDSHAPQEPSALLVYVIQQLFAVPHRMEPKLMELDAMLAFNVLQVYVLGFKMLPLIN